MVASSTTDNPVMPGIAMPKVTMPRVAMIMAAGRGERMRHLTDDTPKPMLEVAGRPLIDWVIARLVENGIERIVVNTCYLGDRIINHLSKRDEAEFVLVPEEERLETGGGVYNARAHLGDEPFFVINADTLWLDGPSPLLRRLAELWQPEHMDALLMVQPSVRVHGDYEGDGDFNLEPDGKLSRRIEGGIAPFVYGGVQLISPSILAAPPAKAFSFNNYWDRAIEQGRLYGMPHDGVWFHVGTPEGLDFADEQLHPERARWIDPLHMV